MQTVGVIGLGLMGGALAGRFLAGGLNVVGFDLREECRHELNSAGGQSVDSIREVLESTSTVVLSLPNSDVVAEVLEGHFKFLAGKRIIDTTTGDPDATAALGERLAANGVGYLDATLTGSSRQATAGELVVTAGGPIELYRECEQLFRMFASRWFHVGTWGSGAKTKLVVNLVLGLNRAVLAEGLTFAKRYGLDPSAILEVLRSGAAYSRAMDVKGPKMIAGEFAPEAKLAQHLKDVRLIRAAGERAGAILPLTQMHEELLANLVARGFGDLDNSAVVRAFDGSDT